MFTDKRSHTLYTYIYIYVGRKRVITLADLDGPVSLVIRDRYIESLFMREEEGRGEGKRRKGKEGEGKGRRKGERKEKEDGRVRKEHAHAG